MQQSIIGYFFQAGPVVKSVMLLLLAASITTWTVIIQKKNYLKQQLQEFGFFNDRFWQTEDLKQLYDYVKQIPETERSGMMCIFFAGFKEYLRCHQQRISTNIATIQRVMQICFSKEVFELEKNLSFLASVGSISPYIGLFGTVWGIMTSFQALGQAQQATIAMVAPGISEALVATALGLFTAIPAVIAYNRFSTNSAEILDQYALFQEELLAIIEQQPKTGTRGNIS